MILILPLQKFNGPKKWLSDERAAGGRKTHQEKAQRTSGRLPDSLQAADPLPHLVEFDDPVRHVIHVGLVDDHVDDVLRRPESFALVPVACIFTWPPTALLLNLQDCG